MQALTKKRKPPLNFSAHGFDTLPGNSEQGAVANSADAGRDLRTRGERQFSQLAGEFRTDFREGIANQDDQGEAVETAEAELTGQGTIIRIEQERIDQNGFSAEEDLIAALIATKRPAFAAGGSP